LEKIKKNRASVARLLFPKGSAIFNPLICPLPGVSLVPIQTLTFWGSR
jgi:hypothetical protein